MVHIRVSVQDGPFFDSLLSPGPRPSISLLPFPDSYLRRSTERSLATERQAEGGRRDRPRYLSVSYPGQDPEDGGRLLDEGNRVEGSTRQARSERSHSVHLLSLSLSLFSGCATLRQAPGWVWYCLVV